MNLYKTSLKSSLVLSNSTKSKENMLLKTEKNVSENFFTNEYLDPEIERIREYTRLALELKNKLVSELLNIGLIKDKDQVLQDSNGYFISIKATITNSINNSDIKSLNKVITHAKAMGLRNGLDMDIEILKNCDEQDK